MPDREKIKHCYDVTAGAYAEQFFGELANKPIDRMLLAEFARKSQDCGLIADFGCGPGQTTRFLAENGIAPEQLLGVDLSIAMVQKAAELNPNLRFETGDMLALSFPDHSFGAAIAFYAIVHFDYEALATALSEINRVLKPGAHFLFSFHIGTEVIHHEAFLGHPIEIDFRFLEVEKVQELITQCGFQTYGFLERHPHPGVEHPSKRAYVWVEKRQDRWSKQ